MRSTRTPKQAPSATSEAETATANNNYLWWTVYPHSIYAHIEAYLFKFLCMGAALPPEAAAAAHHSSSSKPAHTTTLYQSICLCCFGTCAFLLIVIDGRRTTRFLIIFQEINYIYNVLVYVCNSQTVCFFKLS